MELKIKTHHADHLCWIYDRMVFGHNENEKFDYMRHFFKIIKKLKNL